MRKNIEIVNDFYKSIIEGDMELYGSVIHDNVELSMPLANGVLSGTYVGKSRLIEEVFPYVASQLDVENFTFCKRFKVMSEDSSCIVVICEAEGLTNSGKRYDQIYAHFFNFQDSQIIRLIEFHDSGLANRTIWENVQPLKSDAEFSY
jgi:ketosteroid isomerase-like protein